MSQNTGNYSNYVMRQIICALLIVIATTAEAQLIQNGSFEEGAFVQSPDGTDLSPGSSALTGWTISGSDIAWFSNSNSHGVVASDGDKSLDLTGYSDVFPSQVLSQVIATNIGWHYTLNFDFGLQNQGGFSSILARASDDTTDFTEGSATFAGSTGSLTTVWSSHTLEFDALTTSTRISFSSASPGSTSVGLDNVSLQAVPEPSACVALLVGAGAFLRKRRR